MKNTNAKIRVKSHIITDGEGMDFETVTDGNFYLKDGKYYVMYEEKDMLRDFGRCITTVKCDLNTVYMKRNGAIGTNLEFEKNKTNRSTYKFEMGVIVLETHTKEVEISLCGSGGKINLEYDIDIGGQKSYNKVEISVEASEIKGDKNG